MAPEFSGLTRKATFLLAALAALATEVAADETHLLWPNLALAAGWVALAGAMAWFMPRPRAGERIPPRFVSVALLVLTIAPFIFEPLRRAWLGHGYPLEFQMVFALRNLGLGLAACASWLLCLRLAAIVSLFLTLFAVTMTDHPAVVAILGLYSAAGCVWLMLVYWSGLRGWFAEREAAFVEIHHGGWRFPWPAILLASAVVGVTLGLLSIGPVRAARVLAEWLPTSGGTGANDPFARGGINDGEDEIRGRNARTTGMVLSDVFLDSPLPSLYDMQNDLYGEPFKPREQERSIALDGQKQVQESGKPPADNLQPNREFPLSRQSPRRPREAAGRAARALFEVVGRTPVHVRAALYERYDGRSWEERNPSLDQCMLDQELQSNWMRVRNRSEAAFFAANESHQFKITSPLGTLLPTPPHLVRFRVGLVNENTFFAWGFDAILRLSQRKTPTGITVETESRSVDARLLHTAAFRNGFDPSREVASAAPLPSEVQELAQTWTAGLTTPWERIDAVVRHLRSDCVLDWSARPPADCADPLAHFLLCDRRGPDYQFASAAAVLLRSLGFSTRLVNGFYVSPDHYDRATRHTPVVDEDLHFWPEVLLTTGDWLVLEPTPGYEVPGPVLFWSERLLLACTAVAARVRQHALALVLGAAVLGMLWRRRLECYDRALVLAYHYGPSGSWHQRVARVLRLLERRGRWAGQARRSGQSFARWLEAVRADPELACLAQLADWAAYAPGLRPPWTETEMDGTCRRVLDSWTLRRWRTIDNLGTPR
jgi:hypothetical protein